MLSQDLKFLPGSGSRARTRHQYVAPLLKADCTVYWIVSPEVNGEVSAGVSAFANPASTPDDTVVGEPNVMSVSIASSYSMASLCGSVVTDHKSGVTVVTLALSNGSRWVGG